jgi:hypothetical protein
MREARWPRTIAFSSFERLGTAPVSASHCSIQVKTASCVSRSRRVREIVE